MGELEQVYKMKLLILLALCCYVVIQSKPVHTKWKHVLEEWRGKDVRRIRKALDDQQEADDDDVPDEDDDDDDYDDEDECYFTDKCNYYNDNYDPCELAPYDVGCEDRK